MPMEDPCPLTATLLPRHVDDDTTFLTVLTTKPVVPQPLMWMTSTQTLPIPITHYADDNPTVAVPIT